MSKARTLADFISDGSEFADGTISVAEVSGAAPLASPTFTGTTTVSGDFNVFNDNGASAIYDFKSDHYSQIQLTSDVDNSSLGGPYTVQIVANGNNGDLELRTNTVQYMGISQSGNVTFNEYSNDADFRVESDGNTHMLFVDASENAVAIGSASTSTAARLRAAASSVASGDSIVLIDSANDGNVAGNHLRIMSLRGDTSAYNLLTIDNVAGEILNISGNGSVVFNEAGGDRDFRVESDGNTHMLFVDAGGNNVNIASSTDTSYTFNVKNGVQIDVLNDLQDSQVYPIIFATDGGSGGIRTGEANHLVIQSRTTAPRDVIIATRDNSGVARERLTAYGNDEQLVINEDSRDYNFRVESDSNSNMFFVDAGNNLVSIGSASPYTSGRLEVFAQNDNSTEGISINGVSSATSFRLYTVGNVAKIGRGGDYSAISIDVSNNLVINEGSRDQDFRVESDSRTHTLFVDASTSTVNIDQSANFHGNRLNIEKSDDPNDGPEIVLKNLYRSGTTTAGELGSLTFGGWRDVSSTGSYVASIAAHDVSYPGTSGQLRFFTRGSGTTDPSAVRADAYEKMRISHNNVVVNETSNNTDFRVESDSQTHMLFVDAGTNGVGIATSSPNSSSAITVGGSAGDGSPPLRVTSTIAASSTFNYVFQGHITDLPNSKRAALSVGNAHNAYNQTIMGHYQAGDGSTSNYGFLGMHNADDAIVWNTSKEVGIAISPSARLHVQGEAGNNTAIFRNGSDAGNGISIQRTDGTEVGSINWASTSTSFNTSSDYRLKENIIELTGATARLKLLEPKRFNFIADADTTVDGFLAHEVQEIVPEAITGAKDAMRDEEYEVTAAVLDDDGNVVTEAVMGTRSVPDYQGIDQAKLVPLLVATIKELEARITALENA